jgi:hypothetical protein
MKNKLSAVMLLAALLVAGCVGTVSDRKTGGMPLIKDKVEARYAMPKDMVYEAALQVVNENGALINELILHQENDTAKAIEARINQRKVFIRVEPVDEKITAITIQARTKGGGSDRDLAHDLDKQISLQLAAQVN